MLVWISGEAVLWVVGALVEPGPRLLWWSAAAVGNVAGSWAGHPVPGRRFHSREVSFRPRRMVERSRLLLLIAPFSVASEVTGLLALTTTTTMWFLYFTGTDTLINDSAQSAGDRLRVARIAVNSQLIVLASLITIAVANELAIEDPTGATALSLALVMHGGPVLYLAAQTWYLFSFRRTLSRPHLIGMGVLVLTTPLSLITTPLLPTALVAVVLVAVTLGSRMRARTTATR